MADKFLNQTGLAYYHDRAKTEFANKIETVKVNGTALTPDANKAVNVETPILTGSAGDFVLTNGKAGEPELNRLDIYPSNNDNFVLKTVTIDSNETGSEVHQWTVASKNYVDANGGKIDTIKVNGTEQTITNKEVDIAVPRITQSSSSSITLAEADNTGMTTLSVQTNEVSLGMTKGESETHTSVPTKTYVDSTFKTEAQVQSLIDASLADVTGIDFEIVASLPATGVKGTIYLVSNSGSNPNSYDEYIWVTPEGGTAHFEKIGTTDIDLSDYWNDTNLTAITTAEIDTLFA